MKGIDIFCASQAATAIRLSMDEAAASSSSSTTQLGSSRAIDRHNPIIRDARRITKALPPCTTTTATSQSPIISEPLINHHHNYKSRKTRKIKSSNAKTASSKSSSDDQKKKGCAEAEAEPTRDKSIIRKSWSCTKPGEFITPPSSSRYLLSDRAFLDVPSDVDPVLKLVPVQPSSFGALKNDESSASNPPSSSRSADQVVELKVSLHCRGCERKMRKHISKMEGVTSFDINFAAQRVTVIGDVTPLGVLASISKVKKAQLWTPVMPTSLPSANSKPSEIKKNNEAMVTV